MRHYLLRCSDTPKLLTCTHTMKSSAAIKMPHDKSRIRVAVETTLVSC